MSARIVAVAVLTLLGLAACTVNNPPPPAQPTPVIVQPTTPAPGAVVVQPRSY